LPFRFIIQGNGKTVHRSSDFKENKISGGGFSYRHGRKPEGAFEAQRFAAENTDAQKKFI
jgi:hypothetical protein